MRPLFGLHSIRVLAATALLGHFLGGCSEQATCAVEGCLSDDRVKYASDAIASHEAEARAATESENDKNLKSITERIELIEALNELQSQALDLYETRISALETRASTVDSQLAEVLSQIETHEELIADNALKISDLEMSLQSQLDALKDQEEADAQAALQAALDIMTEIDTIKDTIATLDKRERKRHRELAGRIAQLRSLLVSEVERLDGVDAGLVSSISALETQQESLGDQLSELDTRVENYKSIQEIINISFGVAIAGLNEKISRVRHKLEDKIDSLKEGLADTADVVAALSNAIDSLRRKVSRLKDALEETNSDVSSLASQMATMQSDFEADVVELQDALALLEEAVADDQTCTLGDKKGNNGHPYRVLTCGSVSAKVSVED